MDKNRAEVFFHDVYGYGIFINWNYCLQEYLRASSQTMIWSFLGSHKPMVVWCMDYSLQQSGQPIQLNSSRTYSESSFFHWMRKGQRVHVYLIKNEQIVWGWPTGKNEKKTWWESPVAVTDKVKRNIYIEPLFLSYIMEKVDICNSWHHTA